MKQFMFGYEMPLVVWAEYAVGINVITHFCYMKLSELRGETSVLHDLRPHHRRAVATRQKRSSIKTAPCLKI